MRFCTKYGLRVNPVIPLVFKGLSGCYDPKDGDVVDRMIVAASKLVPAVR
ncbi:hypothetical protein GCM10029964_116190 [Kibdelosporangium lantanae]